jgi:hypothetical protein
VLRCRCGRVCRYTRHQSKPPAEEDMRIRSAYVQSACVSIRQQSKPPAARRIRIRSAYVQPCVQHASACLTRAERSRWAYNAYVSIRQHTSAYVSIRQHPSAYLTRAERSRWAYNAYVSIRQHTSAYVSIPDASRMESLGLLSRNFRRSSRQVPAYVSIRQHTSYVSIR